MKTIKQTSIHSRLDTHLAAYAAAGVAIAAPALAPSAKAAIVYSGPISLNVPTTAAGIYLNLVTGVSAVTPAGAPGWDLNPWGTSTLFIYANNAASVNDGVITNFTGGSSTTLVDNLPVGTSVTTGAFTFSRTAGVETTGSTAFAVSSSANYAGFRFLNEATGVLNFGWAQFSTSTTLIAQPRSIVAYAYDNTGASILVGQTSAVPEPTTNAALGLGALAMGAVAVRRMRKSKQAVA